MTSPKQRWQLRYWSLYTVFIKTVVIVTVKQRLQTPSLTTTLLFLTNVLIPRHSVLNLVDGPLRVGRIRDSAS